MKSVSELFSKKQSLVALATMFLGVALLFISFLPINTIPVESVEAENNTAITPVTNTGTTQPASVEGAATVQPSQVTQTTTTSADVVQPVATNPATENPQPTPVPPTKPPVTNPNPVPFAVKGPLALSLAPGETSEVLRLYASDNSKINWNLFHPNSAWVGSEPEKNAAPVTMYAYKPIGPSSEVRFYAVAKDSAVPGDIVELAFVFSKPDDPSGSVQVYSFYVTIVAN